MEGWNEPSSDEDQSKVCPVCHVSAFKGEWCQHLVTVRCDDGDGFETIAPIYFGNGVFAGCNFDDLFNAVVELAFMWLNSNDERRAALERKCQSFDINLRELMDWVIRRLKCDPNPSDNDGYEDRREYIMYGLLALRGQLQDLFKKCWNAEPTSLSAWNWEITSGPGCSWTGTTFWASDAQVCAEGIELRLAKYATVIRAALES